MKKLHITTIAVFFATSADIFSDCIDVKNVAQGSSDEADACQAKCPAGTILSEYSKLNGKLNCKCCN